MTDKDINKLAEEYENHQGTNYPLSEEYLKMLRTQIQYAYQDGFKKAQEMLYTADRCGICGGQKVLIRGRYPSEEKRSVCPTCDHERLEQINEISSRNYGQAYQDIPLTTQSEPK